MALPNQENLHLVNLREKKASLIKPHLVNLSGSGSQLNGAIIERDLDLSNLNSITSGKENAPLQALNHVLVLPTFTDQTKLEWKADGRHKQARFTKGDAILNPAGLSTNPRWEKEVEIVLFAVSDLLINRVAEEMDQGVRVELVPRFNFRDLLLEQLVCNLISEFEQDIPPDLVYAESLMHALIVHLIKKYTIAGVRPPSVGKGLQPQKLKQVTDYIIEHLDEGLSLEEIASVAHYSPSHFVMLFKKSTGLSPHQYIVTKRIEKAKTLLMQTDKSIADVAFQSGFADQSHLTRLMRRHTGLTPKAIRKG